MVCPEMRQTRRAGARETVVFDTGMGGGMTEQVTVKMSLHVDEKG